MSRWNANAGEVEPAPKAGVAPPRVPRVVNRVLFTLLIALGVVVALCFVIVVEH